MSDTQFKHYVETATKEVHEKGLDATLQAVMLYGLGQLDHRVIRLDGKLVASATLAVGTILGGVLRGAFSI